VNPAYQSDETYRRVRRRLLPFLLVSYLVAFLDRNNIGFAKLEFTRDLPCACCSALRRLASFPASSCT